MLSFVFYYARLSYKLAINLFNDHDWQLGNCLHTKRVCSWKPQELVKAGCDPTIITDSQPLWLAYWSNFYTRNHVFSHQHFLHKIMFLNCRAVIKPKNSTASPFTVSASQNQRLRIIFHVLIFHSYTRSSQLFYLLYICIIVASFISCAVNKELLIKAGCDLAEPSHSSRATLTDIS